MAQQTFFEGLTCFPKVSSNTLSRDLIASPSSLAAWVAWVTHLSWREGIASPQRATTTKQDTDNWSHHGEETDP